MTINAESTMGDYVVRVAVVIPLAAPASLEAILIATAFFAARPLLLKNIIGISVAVQGGNFLAGTINAAGDDWEADTAQVTHTSVDAFPYSEPFLPSAARNIEGLKASAGADVAATVVCIMGSRDCTAVKHEVVEVPT